MKPLKTIFALILAVLIILLIAHLFICRVQVLRLSNGKVIDLDQMITEVKKERIIFIGEEHDRQQSHQAELEIIRKIHRAGVPFAIGLEMFTAKSQEKLDQWVAGKLSLQDFIRLYYHDWRMPWSYYRDILLYA
ncbi:MAG: ChaN family lipoprotein, partial [Dehalococcoidia bacterium]